MSHSPNKRGESQRHPGGCQDGRPLWEDGGSATWCCIVPPCGVIPRWAVGLNMLNLMTSFDEIHFLHNSEKLYREPSTFLFGERDPGYLKFSNTLVLGKAEL